MRCLFYLKTPLPDAQLVFKEMKLPVLVYVVKNETPGSHRFL